MYTCRLIRIMMSPEGMSDEIYYHVKIHLEMISREKIRIFTCEYFFLCHEKRSTFGSPKALERLLVYAKGSHGQCELQVFLVAE